jgi:hypothetical protein
MMFYSNINYAFVYDFILSHWLHMSRKIFRTVAAFTCFATFTGRLALPVRIVAPICSPEQTTSSGIDS